MESEIKTKSWTNLQQDLLNNLAARLLSGGKHQQAYEIIACDLAEQRMAKCKLYGESRYEENDKEFDLWMCFSDIHRKYIRLRQLTQLAREGDGQAINALLDAYRDIANYGIMGIQILNKYYETVADED